jgi:hypothetical protein
VVPAVVPPPTPASATVETIPEPLGGQVLTRPHLYTGAVLALLPAALGMGTFFGVLGLALAQGDDLDAEAGIAAIVIGFGAMGAALWWMVYFADFLPSRYLLRLARAAVAQRPDRLVEPDDPDAVFVQVIPRAHWGRMMLENAADVGFLRIDRDRRELLYEGDRERWVVPAAAVVTCAVESFLVGPPGQGSTFYVAVLRARVGSALWEAPFTRRHVYWGPRSQSGRERETRELALAVQALLGRG